ncbi:D-Tyr tRNAtyr deacylase-like domain-containing protein, partial [Chiua virens]
MNAVIQRVTGKRSRRSTWTTTTSHSIVDGKVISSISKGLMVLVGIGTGTHATSTELPAIVHPDRARLDDTPADVDILSQKIRASRILRAKFLCVSQFTLMANTTKGSKPDFHRAMSAETSRQLYGVFLDKMKELYVPDRIKDGQFGAMMDVSLTNEGPVTFNLDTRKFEYITTPNGGGDKGEKRKVKGDPPRSEELTQLTSTSGGES